MLSWVIATGKRQLAVHHLASHLGFEEYLSEVINKEIVTGFVKIDPYHTGTDIHFIAEH